MNIKILIICLLYIFCISDIALAQTNALKYSTLSPKLSLPMEAIQNIFLNFKPLISKDEAIAMKWIEHAHTSDIHADIVTYRNFKGEELEEIIGLKTSLEIDLARGRRLFVMDDEHKVLPFWWKMLKEGIISYDENFLHIDAHLDALIQEKANKPIPNNKSVKNTFDFSFVAKESGFLIPAFTSQIINKNNSYLMDTRFSAQATKLSVEWNNPVSIKKVTMSDIEIIPEGVEFGLICVDLDALAGLTKEEAYIELNRFALLCRKAKAITIATSPQYMLDQKLAIHYAKYLTDLLLNEDQIVYSSNKQINFSKSKQALKRMDPKSFANTDIEYSI